MTEPILTGGDLRPLFRALFGKRFHLLAILVAGTLASYAVLLLVKIQRYEAGAVVAVKIPTIDFEFRIDPNPQVAPAYVDMAQSDALLYDTHSLMARMRRLAEPIAKEYELPETMTVKERDRILRALKKNAELPDKLRKAAEELAEDWQRECFVEPEFFLGLFEFDKDVVDQVPMYIMQESFTVKTNIAQQTNITLVNQPFLNLRVRWDSPGAASVFANLWATLFVERANQLSTEMGYSTEESILKESSKIEEEVAALHKRMAELEARPEYQKLLGARAIENSLYGGRARLDMYGYVELHADIGLQSGLLGELNRLMTESSRQSGKPAEEAGALAAQAREMAGRIRSMTEEARALRGEVADFAAEYRQVQFEIDQRNRLMAERLTTAMFSSTRLKSGYAVPPMVFVERAIPSTHPTGPSRAILALVIGVLCSLLYACWVIYRGFLIPAVS